MLNATKNDPLTNDLVRGRIFVEITTNQYPFRPRKRSYIYITPFQCSSFNKYATSKEVVRGCRTVHVLQMFDLQRGRSVAIGIWTMKSYHRQNQL